MLWSRIKVRRLLVALRVGLFLAVRDLRRANPWTTGLIVLVMVLTFLNLIVVSGILVGLIEGASEAVRNRASGDVVISTLKEKSYIEHSVEIINLANSLPEVAVVVPRYTEPARVEANYKNRTRLTDTIDSAAGQVAGIDPELEDRVFNLSRFVIEGQYLAASDYDQVLLGANLLYKYTPIDVPGFTPLKDIDLGDKVRLVVDGHEREVVVKGVVKAKADQIDQRIFMTASQLRGIIGRGDYNVDEIILKVKTPGAEMGVTNTLKKLGVSRWARVQTWEEAQPKFLKDMKTTFNLLGSLISGIGLAVASITIFIVIFVNAITRRRYIGILKGIGISSRAIELSYLLQSLFYALLGMFFGTLIIFLILKPYFAAHPINFPFSDGILVATISGTIVRGVILFVATMIAGYIPARIVVKQNTLDAILGR